jgi:HK97 family phage major capsid protein
MNSKPTTSTVDKAHMLSAIQAEREALAFYTTRQGQSVHTAREHAIAYDLASIIRGTPGKLETEISARIAESMGLTPYLGGGRMSAVWVPASVLARDLSAGTANLGGSTIENTVSKELTPFLRNRSTVMLAGAKLLDNLRGDFVVTRQTATVTATWYSETEQASVTTTPTFDIAGTLTPHRCHAILGYTNQILQQGSLNIQQIVQNDLLDALAVAIDAAALTGAGSKEPLGVFGTSGVQTITFSGAATASKLIAAEALLNNANVRTGANITLITSPDVQAKWRGIVQAPSTSQLLWDNGNKVLGYPAMSTRQLAAGTHKDKVVLADWSDCFVGIWGGLAILVDRFTQAHLGGVIVHATAMVDVVFKHAVAYVVSTDAGNL